MEAPHGHLLQDKGLFGTVERHLGADGQGVHSLSHKLNFKVVIGSEGIAFVAEKKGRLVYVVNHQIVIAVPIQIAVSDAVGKARNIQAPLLSPVRKGQVAIISKGVIRQLSGRNITYQLGKIDAVALQNPFDILSP